MTVRELIEKLGEYDPGHSIVIAADPIAKSYSMLVEVMPGAFTYGEPWDVKLELDPRMKIEGAHPAVVLYPRIKLS